MKTTLQSNKNRTTKKVTKKRRASGKVYIPRHKIVLMCLGVIAVCMILLLITNLVDAKTNPKTTAKNEPSTEQTVDLEAIIEKPEKKSDSKNEKPAEPKKQENQTVTQKNDSNSKKQTQKNEVEQKSKTETKSEPVEIVREPVKTVTETPKEQQKVPQEDKPAKNVTNNSPVTKTEDNKPAVSTTKTDFGFPHAVNNAQIVFLLDDGGQNLSHLDKFLKLPFPITIAVLPQLAHSKEAAAKIRAAGKELMLHQPMQAINTSVNPGPGAIKPDMTEEQIISTLFQNINEIGPIDGMNNHEGSAITADAEKMAVVMKVASENGIYFLDSRTNKDTKVPYVCSELGYSYYERNGLFLDNVKTRENALTELRKNIDIANKTGVVIMIGHIWSADFLPQLLLDVYPELKAKGYVITTVSKCRGRK